MTLISIQLDKAAIGFSVACAVHCLLLPLALIALPALAARGLGDAHFHQWMVVAVLPTSLLALSLGCRRHRQAWVLVPGLLGLLALGVAAGAGHQLLGESWEKLLSMLGAALLCFAHVRNYRLCAPKQCCSDRVERRCHNANGP